VRVTVRECRTHLHCVSGKFRFFNVTLHPFQARTLLQCHSLKHSKPKNETSQLLNTTEYYGRQSFLRILHSVGKTASAFYVSRSFIAMFARAHCIHSTSSHPISLTLISISSSHLCLVLQMISFPQFLRLKFCMHLISPHATCPTCLLDFVSLTFGGL